MSRHQDRRLARRRRHASESRGRLVERVVDGVPMHHVAGPIPRSSRKSDPKKRS